MDRGPTASTAQRARRGEVNWLFPLCIALTAAGVMTGCSGEQETRFSQPPRIDQTAGADGIDRSNLPTIEAQTLTVQLQPWPQIVRAQGTLQADQISVVAAEVEGRIKQLHVDIGDRVERGQLLAELDPTDYQLMVQQSLARLTQAKSAIGLGADESVDQLNPENAPPSREAKAVWDEAIQQVTRLQQLAEQNAVAQVDLDAALAAERVAEARYASALNGVGEKIAMIRLQQAEVDIAEKQLADTTIVAPLDGRIQSRDVAIGNYVSGGQSLFSVAVTRTLRYQASVPERYASQLRIGQQVCIRGIPALENRPVQIDRIAAMLDPQGRSLRFECMVDNSDEAIRAGVFAESEVTIDVAEDAIVLPASAVRRFAGLDKVWKVTDSVAREVIVRVGRRTEKSAEIIGGLEAGDIVLVDAEVGQFAVVTPPEPGRRDASSGGAAAPPGLPTQVEQLTGDATRARGTNTSNN